MSKDLSKLSVQELGQLFPIIIEEYNREWISLYCREKKMILKAIGINNMIRIDHIGSTAIPGLCAKPTIDILIQVRQETDCILLIKNLESIQYQHIPKPENPPPHIMMAKGYSEAGFTGQTFHIHVRYEGDWDEIVFRDYLIRDPEVAGKYGELKKRLASEFRNDREEYTNAKTMLIKEIVQVARCPR